MSSVAQPYGLKPVSMIGGAPYNGAFQRIPITSAYGTDIFKGDVVKLTTNGVINKDTSTNACTPIGVFLGCQYTDPNTSKPVWSQRWIASTVATDAYAHVVTDPNVVYQIQANGTVAQTALGANGTLVQTAGDTAFNISRVALNYSTADTTNTFPVRIVGFVSSGSSAVGDTYTECLVTFNQGRHQWMNSEGI